MTWEQADKQRAAVTDAQTRVLGRKFCSTCQSMKPLEGSTMRVMGNGRKTFLCAGCTARRRTRSST